MLDVGYAVAEAPDIDVEDYLIRLVPADGPDAIGGSSSSLVARLDAPMCGRLELLEVGVGVIHSVEVCHGTDMIEPLGPVDLDVGDELAEACAGAPYVCEIEDDAWDGERCRAWGAGTDAPYLPWPMPPGTTPPLADGAGCSIAPARPSGTSGAWPLLALLLPRLRRRA